MEDRDGIIVSDVVNGVTSTSTSAWVQRGAAVETYQASVVGTGAVSATVVLDCSNDGVLACSTPLGVITLSGTTSSSDGFTINAPWRYVRVRVTAISGTGAAVSVSKGV